MKTTFARSAGLLAATLLASIGGVFSFAGSAAAASQAPSEGRITVQPAVGTDLTPFTLVTTNACPAGSNVLALIFGKGFPASGKIVVGNSPVAIYQHTSLGGVAMPIVDTLRDFENEEDDPTPLAGKYRLQVECRNGPEAADLGDFEGQITFTGPHAYTATNPSIPVSELTLLPAPGIAHSLVAPAPATTTGPARTAAPVVKAATTNGNAGGNSNGGEKWIYFGGGGALVLGGLVLLIRGRRGAAVAA